MFTTLEEVQKYVRDHHFKMIDLKFSDLHGRWHHVTVPAREFNVQLMRDGVGFDGSAVGLKSVNAGDMVLLPDLSTAFSDPFWDAPTLSFICSAYEADTRNFTERWFGNNILDAPNGVLVDVNSDGVNELWFVDVDGDIFSYNFLGTDNYQQGSVINTGFLGSAAYLTVGDFN